MGVSDWNWFDVPKPVMILPTMNWILSTQLPIKIAPMTIRAAPASNPRFRPSCSTHSAAAMAPKTPPISYSAVMVPVITVLGCPIASSQYSEMTTPDITPWSYPKSKNEEAHTEVIAPTSGVPLRAPSPVLSAILRYWEISIQKWCYKKADKKTREATLGDLSFYSRRDQQHANRAVQVWGICHDRDAWGSGECGGSDGSIRSFNWGRSLKIKHLLSFSYLSETNYVVVCPPIPYFPASYFATITICNPIRRICWGIVDLHEYLLFVEDGPEAW